MPALPANAKISGKNRWEYVWMILKGELYFLFLNVLNKFAERPFTCSKLTTETLKQDVKYVQNTPGQHQYDTNGAILVSLLLTLNIFEDLF